jgi:queuine tRNA-ribosyltransferase
LAAGFFVAAGAGTGPKSETTIAFTSIAGAADHPLSPALLGQAWLTRWRRSGSKFPAILSNEEKGAFEKRIESHRQFSPLTMAFIDRCEPNLNQKFGMFE